MENQHETGLHHVTLITRRVQNNVDFYVGFLGLRLIKQTGGFEDSRQLHLFYGDRTGSPGSIITFLVWEDGSPGRVGNGQVSEVAFSVPIHSIGNWMTKALSHGLRVEGPVKEFGETVLRLKDPDSVIIKLVGANLPASADDDAISRLRGVTLLTEKQPASIAFLGKFGYRVEQRTGNTTRLRSDTDIVDIRDATGYVPGIPGTGTADHVAFRAPTVEAVAEMKHELEADGSGDINFHDRKYFTSLYVREPGGTLIEYASDEPGFLVDETEGELGRTLFVPSSDPAEIAAQRVLLPQFSRPGEPRPPHRDLPFIHRLWVPDDPDGSTLILLHGSGGDETDLMPIANRAAPHATLIGVRGRATEEGAPRWFRRLPEGLYDQADIEAEAEAFEAFVDGAVAGYGIDRDRLAFIGYSNGANFLTAVMARQPDAVKSAALLRPIPVLEDWRARSMVGKKVLVVSGGSDPFMEKTRLLQDILTANGATLTPTQIVADHALVKEDAAAIKEWLRAIKF